MPKTIKRIYCVIKIVAIVVLLSTSVPQTSVCSGRNCYTAVRRSNGCVVLYRNTSGIMPQSVWIKCGFRVYRYPPQ